MKVFIAGASGLVGSNCMKHFKEMGAEVSGSYFSYPTEDTVFFDTLSPANPENFDVVSYKPDVIIHCGALTHVDHCETHEEESYQKTVQSTKNLLAIAKQCNARFVYISTDYVFDGKEGPYTEDAPVNPIIARIIDQCKNNQKLTLKLPYDQYASPTNAFDIARAMYVLLHDNKSGIYHIGSTDYMNRVELALRVLKYFPLAEYDLQTTSTEELKQPAIRPLKGGFVRMKFSNEYPGFMFTNVDDYLKAKL